MDRKRLDEARRILVKAFLDGDHERWTAAVREVEGITGLDPQRITDHRKSGLIRQSAFRLDKAEIEMDEANGITAYSVRYPIDED